MPGSSENEGREPAPSPLNRILVLSAYFRRELREDERRIEDERRSVDEREGEDERERMEEEPGPREEREVEREEMERLLVEDRVFKEDERLTTPRLDLLTGGTARIFPPDDRVDPPPRLDLGVETVPDGGRTRRDLPEPYIDRRSEEDARFSERMAGTLFLILPDRRPEAPGARVRVPTDRDEGREIRAG